MERVLSNWRAGGPSSGVVGERTNMVTEQDALASAEHGSAAALTEAAYVEVEVPFRCLQ